jgi:hypothetical protein
VRPPTPQPNNKNEQDVVGSALRFGCSVWRWVIVAFSAERFVFFLLGSDSCSVERTNGFSVKAVFCSARSFVFSVRRWPQVWLFGVEMNDCCVFG